MDELLKFIDSHGFHFEPTLLDGRFHKINCTKTDTPLWYVGELLGEDKYSLTFGKYSDKEIKYRFKPGRTKTSKEDREKQKAERLLRHEKVAHTAQAKFSLSTYAEIEKIPENYLDKKGLGQIGKLPFDHNWDKDSFGHPRLIVPMKDLSGKIWNLQFIQASGFKTNLPGGLISGLHLFIGEKTETLIICEGLATALTLHHVLGEQTLSAFGLSNIKHVLTAFKKAKIKRNFIVCVDNDHEKDENAGLLAVTKLSKEFGGVSFIRPTDVREGESDYNDLFVRGGAALVKEDIERQIPDMGKNEKNEEKAQAISGTQYDKDNLFVGDIGSFDTGFHYWSGGPVPVQKPSYSDLRTYFDRVYQYKIFGESKICMTWTGTHYEMLADVYIEEFAQKHFFPTAKNNMISEFKGLVLRTNVTSLNFFTTKPQRKINFKNGYYDIDKNTFNPHTKDIGFRYCLPYDYTPDVLCPEFNNFMKRVTKDDEDLENMILEYFGYAVSGDNTWAQKMLVLLGDGANGKSTLVNTIRLVFGEKNASAISVKQFTDANSLALMEGKLINIAEETPKQAFMESDILKNLVTGGIVSTKKLYKDRIEVRMNTKLVLLCNELPPTWDSSVGFYRRFLIAPFKATFDETQKDFDPFIEEKLAKELPGICNRVLDAYKKLKARKRFFVAASAKAALEEYKTDSDQLLHWIRDNIEIHPLGNGHDNAWASISHLYDNYTIYCDKARLKTMNKIVFGRALKRAVPEYDTRYGLFGPEKDRARGVKGVTRQNGQTFYRDASRTDGGSSEASVQRNGGQSDFATDSGMAF